MDELHRKVRDLVKCVLVFHFRSTWFEKGWHGWMIRVEQRDSIGFLDYLQLET